MQPRTPPSLGLGTGGGSYPDGEALTNAVVSALELGYRHVDTAPMYGNQEAVGEGLARSDVPREELFVSSKVSPEDLDYDGVHRSLEASLDRLGVSYVDVLYVHFPTGAYDPAETMPAFEDLHDRGMIRSIGVSNFTPEDLEVAGDHLDVPIAANQVELHPWCQQRDLLSFAADRSIHVVGYCPLIRGRIFDDPVVARIAQDRDLTPAQVGLAWLLGKDGVSVVVKSTTPAHLRENLAATEVDLDSEEVAAIESISRTEKLVDVAQT